VRRHQQRKLDATDLLSIASVLLRINRNATCGSFVSCCIILLYFIYLLQIGYDVS
jgi:hypothetical protein